MGSGWRYSIVPVLVGAATVVAVLPHRGADATVRILGRPGRYVYSPGATQIEPGQRVAFRNETRHTHTATCEGCPWDAGDVQPGQTRFVTFPQAGRFTFTCRYHQDLPLLRGTLTVGEAGDVPDTSPTPTPSA